MKKLLLLIIILTVQTVLAHEDSMGERGFAPIFYKKRFHELPYPYVDIQEEQSNKMQVINNGLAALEKRLKMITIAKKVLN